MTGAVVLKTDNTMTDTRSPVLIGTTLHVDAKNAVMSGANVNIPDYVIADLNFAPVAGTNPTVPTSPVIQTVNNYQEVAFPKGAGLAAAYNVLSGVNEATIYLVLRATLASSDANGVLFRWMASYTGVSNTDKGFMLRRSGSTGTLQFLLDSGAVTASVTKASPGNDFMAVAIGWSVANNTLFLNINGSEVTGVLGSVVGPTGGGFLSFGYSPDYANQTAEMALRQAIGFKSYHDANLRALCIQTLMSANGITG